MTHATRVALLLCGVLTARCGETPSGPTSSPSATITLTSTGLVPAEVRIRTGDRVLFVNNDTRAHEMYSDPVNVHTDCPGINEVGTLSPGESRSTRALIAGRTCGFHDHANEFDAKWKGRIIVQ